MAEMCWHRVKDYGQPTKETCPHGYRIRCSPFSGGGSMFGSGDGAGGDIPEEWWWQPLPPPCDEVAPKPAPVERWTVELMPSGMRWLRCDGEGVGGREADYAADILNTYERDGIVAKPRPWQEAPDDETLVLQWTGAGKWSPSLGSLARYAKASWLPMPPAPEQTDG